MLRFLDRLFGRRPSKLPELREPRKPSQAAIARYEAELEMIRSGVERPPLGLYYVVPVPWSAQILDGEFIGHPLNSDVVHAKDVVEFLDIWRDQSLWLSVIQGCNHDLAITFEIYDWILSQPDCDVQVAIWAFMLLEGPYFCGKPQGDERAEKAEALRPLRRIAQREEAGQHFVVGLRNTEASSSAWGLEKLLDDARAAQSQLAEGQRPLLSIPEKLLGTLNKGTRPVVEYIVHEGEILVMNKAQAAVL